MAAMSFTIIPFLVVGRWLGGKYDPKKPKKED
jgi:hypothetical protein